MFQSVLIDSDIIDLRYFSFRYNTYRE